MSFIWYANAAMALLCAGTLFHAVQVFTWEPPKLAPSGAADTSVSDTEPALAAFNPAPLSAYAQTVSRPAFTPGRKPSPRNAAVFAQAVPSAAAGFELQGVIIAGKEKAALLRDAGEGAVERVAMGAYFKGWRLTHIATDHVILNSANASARIDLRPKTDPVKATVAGRPAGTHPPVASPSNGRPVTDFASMIDESNP